MNCVSMLENQNRIDSVGVIVGWVVLERNKTRFRICENSLQILNSSVGRFTEFMLGLECEYFTEVNLRFDLFVYKSNNHKLN